MDEKICDQKHRYIEEKVCRNEKRLNRISEKVDLIENDIVAQKKDTIYLNNTLQALQKSIDKLIDEISNLKIKPLAKYEKVAMVIVTAVVGYVVGKVF